MTLRTRFLGLSAVLAAALVLTPALAAFALPAADAVSTADGPPPTWSVEPSSSTGADDRASLAYSVDPGSQIRDFVAVTNLGTEPLTFSLYATDATNDFETGAFSLLPSDTPPTDVGAWVTLPQDSLEVAPGAQAIVPFQLLIASDATPGDHTGGIVAAVTTESTDESGQAIKLEQRVGARIYLRVSGTPSADLGVTGLVTSYAPSLNPFGGGSVTVDYGVSNTGNVRLDVAQQVVLHGPFGWELAVTRPAGVVNLLPGQATHVTATFDGIPPVFLYWATVTLTPQPPTDLVGESEEQGVDGAAPVERVDPDFAPSAGEQVAIAISWTLLIVLLVAAALIWLIARYVSRSRQQFFDAIDEAAETARASARRELEAEARAGSTS